MCQGVCPDETRAIEEYLGRARGETGCILLHSPRPSPVARRKESHGHCGLRRTRETHPCRSLCVRPTRLPSVRPGTFFSLQLTVAIELEGMLAPSDVAPTLQSRNEIKTLSGGSLGSRVDEERSQLRELM